MTTEARGAGDEVRPEAKSINEQGLLSTIYGWRDPAQFARRTGTVDNENEITHWVEYWDGDTLVHRSAHVTLKKLPDFIETTAGGFQ